MAQKKRKAIGAVNTRKDEGEKKMKSFPSKTTSLDMNKHKKKRSNNKDERRGPRLPSSLRREVDSFNPIPRNSNSSDDEEELQGTDFYEYDEAMAEEETQKNRRFDRGVNLQYELPDEFEDENLSSSDDDDKVNHADESKGRRDNSDQSGDDAEEDGDGRHARMLQGITGMPAEAFEGKKKKFAVVSEAYPESEYNPSGNAVDGDGRISIQDLLDPLQEKRGYSELRKKLRKVETKSMSVQTPLPKVVREKLEMKVAYDLSKKDITKWEPLIKMNREAPTIFFDEDINLGFSTVGAIASEFKPRTEFEKKINALVQDAKVVEAHKEDGARLLELNKISMEDVKDRQNRLAKLRSLLFRHELKAKHIKKIKSKTFHRLLKKDKLKGAYTEMLTDPEAAKEQAMKQEFKRAEERMTLKHKNNSKWARRILERGLNAQDEGTRVALSEQLHQHALLTRKMNSMKDSSSDESSDTDDDDELVLGTEQDGASKLLTNAKEKTIKVLEEDGDKPTSGVLSLPFMVRREKKRKDEADAEAKLALEEFESSLKQLEDTNEAGSTKASIASGRRVFGLARKQPEESENKIKSSTSMDSDSEDEYKAKANVDVECTENGALQKEVHTDANVLHEESYIGHKSVFKSLGDTIRDPGPKTTYEVAIFTSNSWKKMGSENATNGKNRESPMVVEPALPHQNLKEVDADEDTESEEETVDGIVSGTKQDYELPSQEDLIHRAFAGDDVEEEFEKDKLEVVNEENPEPEKPVLLPGWGQWTHVQKKKGMPSWMLEEHESAKKKREDSLKKRKDAELKHVIISEKINKKAEKLQAKTLPFPFKSSEQFEGSLRFPIGPEFNPAVSFRELTRPPVVKKPGVIIKPIQYKDVNPYDKEDEHKSKTHNHKTKNTNSSGAKTTKKMKTKQKI